MLVNIGVKRPSFLDEKKVYRRALNPVHDPNCVVGVGVGVGVGVDDLKLVS